MFIYANLLSTILTKMYSKKGTFQFFNQINYFRFGVVCTFVSNEYIEDGVKELPSNLKKSLNDTRLFINNTKTVRNAYYNTITIDYRIDYRMVYSIINAIT